MLIWDDLDLGQSFILLWLGCYEFGEPFKSESTQPFEQMRHPVLLFVLSRREENGPRAVVRLFWTRN